MDNHAPAAKTSSLGVPETLHAIERRRAMKREGPLQSATFERRTPHEHPARVSFAGFRLGGVRIGRHERLGSGCGFCFDSGALSAGKTWTEPRWPWSLEGYWNDGCGSPSTRSEQSPTEVAKVSPKRKCAALPRTGPSSAFLPTREALAMSLPVLRPALLTIPSRGSSWLETQPQGDWRSVSLSWPALFAAGRVDLSP